MQLQLLTQPASIYFLLIALKSVRCQILVGQLEERMPGLGEIEMEALGQLSPIHFHCPFPQAVGLEGSANEPQNGCTFKARFAFFPRS